MATITEDYVSFETAKLLKEKGFDEICYLGYNKNGEYFPTSNRTNSQIIQPDFCFICCPTLQMAMKWLREVHNIHIVPIHVENRTYRAKINGLSIFELDNPSVYLYGKYEYVIEFAIKYALEKFI